MPSLLRQSPFFTIFFGSQHDFLEKREDIFFHVIYKVMIGSRTYLRHLKHFFLPFLNLYNLKMKTSLEFKLISLVI